VYGGVPPVACSVWLYATPTIPPGRLVVVTVGAGGGSTVIERSCVSVWVALSVTLVVNEKAPALLGVPLTTPVEAFSVRPAGSDPLSSDQA
jgi:hypothetical protein